MIIKKFFLAIFLTILFVLNSDAQLISGRIQLPFKVNLSQEKEKIKVNFKLENDSHIYKDSISIEEVPNYKIDFPLSISKLDKFSNKIRQVYHRNFSLSINFKELKLKNDEINLNVRYQGCTSKVCFLPQKENLKLKLNKK